MKARLPQGMGKGPAGNMNQMLKQAQQMQDKITALQAVPAGNMNQMLKQAQQMQDKITALQADLEQREFTASVGGGAVEIKINGKREVLSLNIKPEVVDPEDVEMLQDLIMSAFNEAVHNLDEVSDAEMSELTGGVSFPGLF